MASPVDIVLIVLTILLPILFIYRDSLPYIGGKSASSASSAAAAAGNGANGIGGKDGEKREVGDPRDFVEKMESAVSLMGMFWGCLLLKDTFSQGWEYTDASFVLFLL